jgi:hypothetical protein
MHVGKNLNARSFFTEPIERLFSSFEKQHERNRVRSEHNAERNNCYLTNPRVMPNLLTVGLCSRRMLLQITTPLKSTRP